MVTEPKLEMTSDALEVGSSMIVIFLSTSDAGVTLNPAILSEEVTAVSPTSVIPTAKLMIPSIMSDSWITYW